MSLTETNLISITKSQFLHKIKSHLGLFNVLAAIQLIVLFLTFGRAGMIGTSSEGISLEITKYSGDLVLISTLLWVLYISIIFTTEAYRNADFTFVSNRLSSNLSNIGFLFTASALGGVTASLSGGLVRLLLYFSQGSHNIIGENFYLVPQELLLGLTAAVLYMILFSAVGYLIGILIKHSKIFILLLPALFLGALYLQGMSRGKSTTILAKLVIFFVHENSLGLLTVKILATGAILFVVGILISNRTEVRQ
ncbi:MAG: hypothetical protein AAGU27_09810 [Dehalobacterium sp.]